MSESLLRNKYFHGLPVRRILRAISGNTEIKTVDVSGIGFHLELITTPDKLLEATEDKLFHLDERMPYWCQLWPSSFALAEYILERTVLFKNREVLEVGCGLGLCGIAARHAGAAIDLTDYDPIALYFTKRNYQRNFAEPAQVYYLDWRGPFPDRRFDIIIGADVLYEKRFFLPLYNLVQTLLKPGGLFIFAEPQRAVAREFTDLFLPQNWKCSMTEKIVQRPDQTQRINIHHNQRC